MYLDGFMNIVNFDYSPTVISQMISKYSASCSQMEYVVADVTNLSRWSNESFDLIMDKGCVDAMFEGELFEAAEKGLAEMYRLLLPSGYFVLITLGNPDMRRSFIERANFSIEQYEKIQTRKEYTEHDLTRIVHSFAHVYVCKKHT